MADWGQHLLLLNTLGFQASGWPALELHAQGQAARGKHFFDFVERLTAQIRRFEQLVFLALDEVANVENVFCFEAVGRTNGEFEFVHRAQQNRIELLSAAGCR